MHQIFLAIAFILGGNYIEAAKAQGEVEVVEEIAKGPLDEVPSPIEITAQEDIIAQTNGKEEKETFEPLTEEMLFEAEEKLGESRNAAADLFLEEAQLPMLLQEQPSTAKNGEIIGPKLPSPETTADVKPIAEEKAKTRSVEKVQEFKKSGEEGIGQKIKITTVVEEEVKEEPKQAEKTAAAIAAEEKAKKKEEELLAEKKKKEEEARKKAEEERKLKEEQIRLAQQKAEEERKRKIEQQRQQAELKILAQEAREMVATVNLLKEENLKNKSIEDKLKAIIPSKKDGNYVAKTGDLHPILYNREKRSDDNSYLPVIPSNDDVKYLAFKALEEDNVPRFEMLMKRIGTPNVLGLNGETPLTYALKLDSPRAVAFLVAQGANLNMRNVYFTPPLHNAIKMKNLETFKMLIREEVDIEAIDGYRRTPLIYAVYMNFPDAVKILIEKGVDLKAKDNNNETALMIADRLDRTDIKKILIQAEHQSIMSRDTAAKEEVIASTKEKPENKFKMEGRPTPYLHPKSFYYKENLVDSESMTYDDVDNNAHYVLTTSPKNKVSVTKTKTEIEVVEDPNTIVDLRSSI